MSEALKPYGYGPIAISDESTVAAWFVDDPISGMPFTRARPPWKPHSRTAKDPGVRISDHHPRSSTGP